MVTNYYSRSFSIFLLIVDLILFDLSYIIAYQLRYDNFVFNSEQYVSFLVLFDIVWIISSLYNKMYLFSKITRLRNAILKLIGTFAVHIGLISLAFVAFKAYEFSRLILVYTYLFGFLFIFVLRIVYYFVTKNYYKKGINAKKSVIVGSNKAAKKLADSFLTEKASGYKFIGYFDDKPASFFDSKYYLGKVEDVKTYCSQNDINEIYYAKDLTDTKLIQEFTDYADKNFKYLKFVPDFRGFQKSKIEINFFKDTPIISYTNAPLGGFYNQMIKRAFDIAFSLGVIIFIYPFIFPIIALLIKLESKGPVLFKQLRPGKGNELFKCYKFRTMKVNNSAEKQATKNDPRITKIGAFLRKTSLDEFPQFLNVLQGKMSIVGPRPNMISQLEYYSKEIDKYNFRHFITPGITGYAQVNGFRGETKEMELMKKRVEYDAWYIENWSLSLDIKIIFLTVWNMIKGEEYAY